MACKTGLLIRHITRNMVHAKPIGSLNFREKCANLNYYYLGGTSSIKNNINLGRFPLPYPMLT